MIDAFQHNTDHPQNMKGVLIAALLLATAHAQGQSPVVDYQQQVVQLYPDIGRAGTEINRRFLEAVSAARTSRPELFQNPEWPLTLAREVAGQSQALSAAEVPDLAAQGRRPAKNAAHASPDTVTNLELALQAKSIPKLIAACEAFHHPNALFRAQVASLKEQFIEASKAMADARNWNQRMAPEIARIRKNARVSGRPNPLVNDGSNQERAQEQNDKADALEDEGRRMLQEATNRAAELADSTNDFIAAVREADEQERKRLAAQMEEGERKRLGLEKLKRTQEFFDSLNEPEGQPGFADRDVSPTYKETIDFINGKLLRSEWRLRYGARSNQFILVHPEGAYFFRAELLNRDVKFATDSKLLHFVQIEVSDANAPIRVVARERSAQPDARKIIIPCADQIDSEKLAKAFGHLIGMAGGKADPF